MWVWWYVNALPTSLQRKTEFLKLTSLRERLLMLRESLHLPILTATGCVAGPAGSLPVPPAHEAVMISPQ
jgi:hypothetical protein